ncbi:MAG: hypothetical protein L0387_20035 [Acidobacteria bacterium]|nr:hypothetical protein [Acidobacteriota bacterium]MCI0722236.1 hypothetical protein [Acidobacteriota bacterium]
MERFGPDLEPAEGEKIAREILGYLKNHPEAKDTLDGISRWWLPRGCGERRLAEVQRAVSLLLAKSLVVETRRQGLPPYYRLNPEKHEETSKILKDT